MYIYNSLTNQKEVFKTIIPNKVNMYVCGPTVYNYIHIGNARPVIFFDVVKRYLEHRGYDVTYVSNITNVDDKIINAAKENQVSEEVIANRYKEAFLENVKQLNCVEFDINPSVTDYMSNIINYIKELENLGYAYEVEGDVYFSVNKISSYGQLSNQETESLEIGARITEHSKKQNPLDFTLWKKTDDGIKWDSPWGKGRPGWHTECVAMINDTLGSLIDIHGGGSDLKFPHHENEIAQSMAMNKTILANYWMHNGRLMIDNEKMSKSLGNYILINDFLSHYDFRVLRLFMLSTHYRQPLNYTFENIENIKNEVTKIETSYKQLQMKLDLNHYLDEVVSINDFSQTIINQFNQAMDDDFNSANAITALMNLIKEVNKVIRKQIFTIDELKYMLSLHHTFKQILMIFGISYEIPRLDNEIRDLIKIREEARKNKDFEKADKIRAILNEKGINI
ncbi:cysteine--tRNA ligase [Mycoplasmatota bacterium]|nr:cysteine--tRNA ligase [Mycoplasmatota bacterium]